MWRRKLWLSCAKLSSKWGYLSQLLLCCQPGSVEVLYQLVDWQIYSYYLLFMRQSSIFTYSNIRSYFFTHRIYSNIHSQYFWHVNIFGYSFVASSAYEYIRIFIQKIFCHTNIFGYSFMGGKIYSLHTDSHLYIYCKLKSEGTSLQLKFWPRT